MKRAAWSWIAAGVSALALAGCQGKRVDPQKSEGAALFATKCARCHGLTGNGVRRSGMGPRAKDLRDPEFQANRSDGQLREAIQAGKPPVMPPFAAELDDAQLDSLVGHIRTLRRK